MISIKKLSIFALILLLLGAVGSLFTFSSLNQATAVAEEKIFHNDVTSIKVNAKNVGVEVLPTKEATGKVELYGNKSPNTNYSFSSEVEGETLSIIAENNEQSWINIYPISLMIKIYLPEKQYKSLHVDSDTGLIRVKNVNVKNVRTRTTNGWTDLKSITAVEVDVESNNGQITFEDVKGKVAGKTKNGQITFVAKSIDRPIQLETGGGRILIQTEQKPSNVTFDVNTGSGRINILDSYMGSTVIGDGENLVKLTTGAGSITVE